MENTSGRRWSRSGLAFGAALSLMGNVAHTCLVASSISLWLRLPLAVVWPVALFVGIEILVRVIWRRKFIDIAGRFLLIVPVSAVAAVVSYQHLHALMRMAGEDGFSALIGPLAVDGLMLGSTVALLAIRAAELPTLLTDAPDLDDVLARYEIGRDWDLAAEMELAESFAEVVAPVSPSAPRAPRAVWDYRKVAEMAVDGQNTQKIVDATGAGRATVDRFRKVAKMLNADPRAIIDSASEKLRPEYVTAMRELVSR
jgi:Protein of unknown function (DUF2637)